MSQEEFADLLKLFDKIFLYSTYLSTSGTLFSTSGLSMQPHSARVGNKLLGLSELVMIKSNTKSQPVLL